MSANGLKKRTSEAPFRKLLMQRTAKKGPPEVEGPSCICKQFKSLGIF